MACTIPVFRYALDRWQPDAYRLVMPHAAAKERALALALLPYRGNGPANFKVEETAEGDAAEAKLYSSTDDQHQHPLWKGTLTPDTLAKLLDSPARQDLLQKLLAGDSLIWVVVDGGKESDKAEEERIRKRLKYLEQVVDLPPQDPDDPDSQLGPGPALKLKLTCVHVSFNDEKEKLFCAMLAGTKCAEALAKGQSFAAPVFGRGRVLGSYPLTQLDDTALEDISIFLTGRCSCRVKNQSPGWDVLLKVDWEAALQKVQDGRKAAKEEPQVRGEAKPEVVKIVPRG
jgi:hypothetical protein